MAITHKWSSDQIYSVNSVFLTHSKPDCNTELCDFISPAQTAHYTPSYSPRIIHPHGNTTEEVELGKRIKMSYEIILQLSELICINSELICLCETFKTIVL